MIKSCNILEHKSLFFACCLSFSSLRREKIGWVYSSRFVLPELTVSLKLVSKVAELGKSSESCHFDPKSSKIICFGGFSVLCTHTHYVKSKYVNYGVYDYDKGDKYTDNFRLVSRYTGLYLLLNKKTRSDCGQTFSILISFCFSLFFISLVRIIRSIAESIAVSTLTPTKLNHIPSSPNPQNAPKSTTGKTNAVATDITVAWSALPSALK